MLGGFGEGLSQEARSLLPEIGPGMSLMKMGMMDDSLGPSRLSFNETDDPQRYHFEETTFAAPNILRELSDTLTRFEHAFREYRKKSRPQDAVGSTVPSPGPKQIDFFSSGVKHVLAQEWDDMISETIYTPRQWQSQAYKSGYKYSPTLASGRQIMTASATDEKYPGAKGDLKVKLIYEKHGVSLNFFRIPTFFQENLELRSPNLCIVLKFRITFTYLMGLEYLTEMRLQQNLGCWYRRGSLCQSINNSNNRNAVWKNKYHKKWLDPNAEKYHSWLLISNNRFAILYREWSTYWMELTLR